MAASTTIDNSHDAIVRKNTAELSIYQHDYIVLSKLYEWLLEVAGTVACGVFLDYGCGGIPYRRTFEPYVSEYIAVDVAPAAGVILDMLIEPNKKLSLMDGTVDTILSSQVLEHVSDPCFYLKECFRLLRPTGKLIITVPMQWRLHEEPHDFHRFTKYGLVQILNSANLKVLDLRPAGGAFALLGQVLSNTLSAKGFKNKLIFGLINKLFLWLDAKYPDYKDTLIWMCVAAPLKS